MTTTHTRNFLSIFLLTGNLVTEAAAADLVHARDGSGVYGYKDTPKLPWCAYLVHDPDRPAPRRVNPGPAAAPAAPPSDAVVLFDGKDLAKWQATEWKLVDGCVEARGGNLVRNLLMDSQGDLQRAWKAASIGRQELRHVESLDLSMCSGLSDLTPLRALRALKSLNLAHCTSVSDIDALSSLTSLTRLVLEDCSKVLNIEPLVGLKALRFLVLGAPVDRTPLKGAESLREIHLHYRESGKVDLTSLAGLAQLSRVCAGREDRQIRIADELRADPGKIVSEGVRDLVLMSQGTRRPRGSKKHRPRLPRAADALARRPR